MLDGSAAACVVCINQEQNGKNTKYEFWAVPFYPRNYRDKSCYLKYAIHRVALSVYHYYYTKFQLTRGQAGGLYNFVCKEPLTNGATATWTNVSSS